MAQLGARFHGMEEVVGSIPTRSTKSFQQLTRFKTHCEFSSNPSFNPSHLAAAGFTTLIACRNFSCALIWTEFTRCVYSAVVLGFA